MLTIALAYVLVTIPIGGGDVTIEGGIYPEVVLQQNIVLPNKAEIGGLATPFGTISADHRFVQMEEALHLEQWLALGPWYLLSYAITGGEPFEPYGRTQWGYSPPAYSLSPMWQPDARRYHQWTVTVGDEISVRFMRGWWE